MNELTMGQRIAQERKRLGLSQEALGEKLGISRQAISKWESDGAVPEIDKLIALSKLFGVSVGWLLGVEKQQENRTEELNETQLKMVEEIVRRYQPESMEKKFPWIAGILMLGAALVIVAVLFSFAFRNRGMDAYDDRISGLESDYNSIRSHLLSINSRLDDMAVAAEATEALLLEYELNFEDFDTDERERAVISVLAIPKAYSGGSASLTVLQKGQPVTEAPLDWNGTGFGGSMVIPLGDDYQYCFVLETDGSRQVQILETPGLSDLASNSVLACGADLFGVGYDPHQWDLEINHLYLWAQKPIFGDNADLIWSEFVLEFYRNGEFLGNDSFGESGDNGQTFSMDVTSLVRRDIKLEEGDLLELRLRACCTNGTEVQGTAALWQYSGGQLTDANHIE